MPQLFYLQKKYKFDLKISTKDFKLVLWNSNWDESTMNL